MSAPLFTFRQLPTVKLLLEAHPTAFDEVMRAAGFSSVSTAEITAPLSKVQDLLERAAKRTGSAMFGLDLAERIPAGAYGVTEFVVKSAPTLRHALSGMVELSPLINPALDMRYVADDLGCELHFSYGAERDALGEILNEYTVAYIARQFIGVLGRPLPVSRMWFAHGRKAGHEELARRLECNVRFQAADCGFAVASNIIDEAIVSGNEALFAFLLAQGRTQLANIGKADVITQATRAIEARISDAQLNAALVASALQISQRTLQRQLGEAGTTYRNLVSMIRQRRREELARSGLDDAEIAMRLGFANAKTMRRSLDDVGEDSAPADEI